VSPAAEVDCEQRVPADERGGEGPFPREDGGKPGQGEHR
jgi:hypothetical protein